MFSEESMAMLSNIQQTNSSNKSLLLFVVLLLSGVTVFFLYHLESIKHSQINLSKQKILQEAIAHFETMVVARSWNAQHGGLFVKQNDGLKPNPYLKNNTLLTDTQEILIKVNPAWMTRQLSELSNKKSNFFYKITSLKPINPDNKADVFEKQALEYFELNKDQKYYHQFKQNLTKFNFMGVLKTEQACLQCHEQQGYKLGDVRGGIRVSIPIGLFKQEIETLNSNTKNSQVIVISVALLILIAFFSFLIYKSSYRKKVEVLKIL